MTAFHVAAPDDVKDRKGIKNDPMVQTLATKRPAEINDWVDANVTDLNSARFVLKLILRIIVALLRRELQNP